MSKQYAWSIISHRITFVSSGEISLVVLREAAFFLSAVSLFFKRSASKRRFLVSTTDFALLLSTAASSSLVYTCYCRCIIRELRSVLSFSTILYKLPKSIPPNTTIPFCGSPWGTLAVFCLPRRPLSTSGGLFATKPRSCCHWEASSSLMLGICRPTVFIEE
jgi:hypothetical protein